MGFVPLRQEKRWDKSHCMLQRNDNGESAAAFYEKRRKWLDFICEVDGLTDRAFRVGYWLAKRMNGDDQCCWYTQREVAKRMGLSEDKVIRAVMELEDKGVLIVVRSHRKPNYYHIRLPFDFG
ncbi:helix-turn-helix domain-containing protein [Rhizobium sp. BK251]|uniref:helix-turn-helix domain-containing protein n=1 Tax=Rhizobium sp. BK251 TaxID=2512125 RepID=UPI0010529B2B|nr:helix-turn-helix domain-containing protein [Rhizobium sp. BK251]TCL70612.1 helix-turn-helix protein [Rhizobium sp. BK251]